MTEGNHNPSRATGTPRRPTPPLSASATLPSPTSGRAAGGAPPRRRRKATGGIVALLLIGLVAVGVGTAYKTLKNFGGGTVSLSSWVNAYRHPRDQFPNKNRVNVLLIGMDYSYLWTKRDPKLSGARYTKNSRADSIMMLSLDLDNDKVSALSIPRDTHVTAPDGKVGKINGTFSRGGAPLLCQTVTQLLGVAPDYYIAVKPDAVRDMVNALGGVTVQAKDAMEYNDSAAHLHILLPAGQQKIDGDQAVGFARFREADRYERNPDGSPIYTGEKDSEGNPIFRQRHVITHSKEEGDPNRMARQQQLIRAMATRAKSPDDWLRVPNIVQTAMGELQTNLDQPHIMALLALFSSLQPDQIQSASLEGKGTVGGTYYFMPDEKKKAAMVDWLLKGDETAADRLTVVAVENGTSVRGAAARVAAKLCQDGFDAKSAAVATPTVRPEDLPAGMEPPVPPGNNPVTRITYAKASVATRAQKIGQLLGVPAAQITKEAPPAPDTTPTPAPSVAAHSGHHAKITDTDTADVTVVLGQDVAATFAAPQQSARL